LLVRGSYLGHRTCLGKDFALLQKRAGPSARGLFELLDTYYKIYNRYKDSGLDGLNDRSRAPYRQANKLPFQIERTILWIKKEHPSWGARKIRDKLLLQYSMIKPPAISTVHAVLDRK